MCQPVANLHSGHWLAIFFWEMYILRINSVVVVRERDLEPYWLATGDVQSPVLYIGVGTVAKRSARTPFPALRFTW
jgi:hypothetical protein